MNFSATNFTKFCRRSFHAPLLRSKNAFWRCLKKYEGKVSSAIIRSEGVVSEMFSLNDISICSQSYFDMSKSTSMVRNLQSISGATTNKRERVLNECLKIKKLISRNNNVHLTYFLNDYFVKFCSGSIYLLFWMVSPKPQKI